MSQQLCERESGCRHSKWGRMTAFPKAVTLINKKAGPGARCAEWMTRRLFRIVGLVEGVLQGNEVFAGLEGVEDGLLGFELLG